jgi:hypothetical protein
MVSRVGCLVRVVGSRSCILYSFYAVIYNGVLLVVAYLSSRPVASVNLIVVWIAFMSGVQSLLSYGDFPLRRRERLLLLNTSYWSNCSR